MSSNPQLRLELLAMRAHDAEVRDKIIKGASAFDGYHPQMEEVHKRNAARLKEIIAEYGWPGRSLVGEDGMIAAWFIAQHAIGDPPFQRRALELIKEAHSKGEASAIGAAFLEDRICVFEGRPQFYGTQFEDDETGMPQPCPIADPEHVNERRKALGMNTIEERTEELRAGNQPEKPDPERLAAYRRDHEEWLRRVGWRR